MELKNEIQKLCKKINLKIDFTSDTWETEFVSKVNWVYICYYQKLSESFIEKFQDKVYWDYISSRQKLSESFIEKFQDKVDWDSISESQKLSEAFIEKFHDKVYWRTISTYQKLSEAFIEKFQDKVSWYCISNYHKLSKKFIKKHKLNVGDNWNYVTTDFKKSYIKKNTKYEFFTDKDGDYIIAYKGIRSDRYSKYNFQYQYLKGETYTSHCDCTNDNNSFGLSAWTYEKASEYCNQLVIKVKVYIKDIGRIVHDNKKIRCFKFKVLE